MKKPCKKCGEPKHLKDFPKVKANRDGHGGKCKECENKQRRKLNKDHYWSHHEKRKKKSRDWHNKNRFKVALYHSAAVGKKCTATFEEVAKAFDGRCAICAITEDEYGRKLHMDHCHRTGRLRKFLCQKCNQGLGSYGDSVDLLIAAAEYLYFFN